MPTKNEIEQLKLLKNLAEKITEAYGNITEKRILALVNKHQADKKGYKNIVEYINAELQPAFIGSASLFSDSFTSIYTNQQKANFRAGIGLNFNLKDERTISLISNNNAFIWSKYYGVKNSPEIQKQLKEIWKSGYNSEVAAKKIMDSVGRSEKRTLSYTKTVVETQSAHVRGMADLEQYSDAKITSYQYIAVIDNVTTDQCRSLNGKIYNVKRELKKQKKILEDVNEIINNAIDNEVEDYKSYNQISAYYHKNRPLVTEQEDGTFKAQYTKATKDPESQGKTVSKIYNKLEDVPNATIPPIHFNCRSFLRAIREVVKATLYSKYGTFIKRLY